MAQVYLSLGSNLGNRMENLEKALDLLSKNTGEIMLRSYVYETGSWGYQGLNYLNMAVKILTRLEPGELMVALKKIEKDMGRVKTPGIYTDRSIDLDILFYDNLIYQSSDLEIPHPQIPNRLFVLAPLMDIAPDHVCPQSGKKILEIIKECEDRGWIQKYNPA
ncbi:MAG: 2-amino-4-hydroxy-6-hydroxymethyldihydropteridine diphosphokinase [Bacteroidales bacterium]|nr:2-amino-4-hydroxy-6-hydroxymethyldihydropteridine diphosphokinase [Bacteroidales bacterium]